MWALVLLLGGLLLGGVLIGVVLGVIGIVFTYVYGGGAHGLMIIPIATWEILFNYSLTALPLYILLGEIFVASGLAGKSYEALVPLFERFPGKLLLTNVALDTMLGAVVGSSMATAATGGAIAYPELSKRGYDRTALVGNLAGAGTLGSFVPPSLGMIIYGAWVEISIGGLFMALLIPALMTSGLFIIFVVIYCKLRPGIAPGGKAEIVPLASAIAATRSVWPLALLMFCIMGTIYFGIATATEAAGLAVTVALIMSFAIGSFSLRKLYDALMATVRICGMLLFIIMGATIFAVAMSSSGLPRQVIMAVAALDLSPIMVTCLVYVLYLILGCFFDFISMLVMTLPFIFPIMMAIGADPFWLGVAVGITGEMGLLTPPVGMNLFILQAVTHGEVSLGEVAKGSMPYLAMLGVTLLLITVFPDLCTWLPSHMR